MKAVIFDVDGTLIDSVDIHARAWDETLRHFGYQFDYATIRHGIGMGADQYLKALLGEEESKKREKELTEFRVDLFKRKYLSQIKPFPQVRELFEKIRGEQKKIAVASSAKKEELDGYLKLANVADLLDASTCSDDAEKSKPHPDIFQAAIEKLGVSPQEAAVVGDTPHDGEAARRAGNPFYGVLCGGFPEAELRATQAKAVFRDPADLLTRYPAEWRASE